MKRQTFSVPPFFVPPAENASLGFVIRPAPHGGWVLMHCVHEQAVDPATLLGAFSTTGDLLDALREALAWPELDDQ